MKKNAVNYAFVDSQNLNLGVRSQGWRIDYKKFRLYLKNKYNVEQAFMFIGLIDNNQGLYTDLQRAGDGDFHCLHEYLEEKGKLLHIIVPNKKYSKLLKKFIRSIVRIDLLRSKLEYRNHKKSQPKRSVETLGRTGGKPRSSGRSKP